MTNLKLSKNQVNEINKYRYKYIDLYKFIFSILIVLMHIDFNNNLVIDFIKQYVSRLGVPYFFTAAGFLLSKKLMTNNRVESVLYSYLNRVLLLFITWSLIYAPYNIYIIYKETGSVPITVLDYLQRLLFMSPSFMWYLGALAIATIPYCLLYKDKFWTLFSISFILYIIGTIGNSYQGIYDIGIQKAYINIFLTTRNGIFFAPIFLCIGGLIYKYKNTIYRYKHIYVSLILSYLLFMCEVFLVRSVVPYNQDTSMYFSLPVVIYYIFIISISKSNISRFSFTFLRKASTVIYCSQFGFILVFSLIHRYWGFVTFSAFYVYLLTIISGIALTSVFTKSKIKLFNKLI